MQRLKEIIENFDQITLEDVDLLKQSANQYPYSSIIQLAYACFLHKQENYNFNTQLKLTAAVINSRTKLFNIIHGSNIAKVLLYHQPPVYVQEFDKIDDLKEQKNEELVEEFITKNKLASEVNEISYNETETEDKNTLKDRKVTSSSADISTTNAVEEKVISAAIDHTSKKAEKKDIAEKESTENAIESETSKNNITPETENKPINNQSTLDAIREKIKAKFGNQNPVDKHTNENENENVSGEIKPDPLAEEVHENLIKDKLKDAQDHTLSDEDIRKNKQLKEQINDNLRIPVLKNENDNEKLEEVKLRARNILLKIEQLKLKYGNKISKPIPPKEENISYPQTAKHEIENISVDTKPDIIDGDDAEFEGEFDLTNSPLEEHSDQSDATSIKENDELFVLNNEEVAEEDTNAEKEKPLSGENIIYAQISTPEIVLESDNMSHPLQENIHENIQARVEEKRSDSVAAEYDKKSYEDINESDDIFSRWLKTLENPEDRTHTSSEKSDKDDVHLREEATQVRNTDKKIEKLKIIDNFLSGNIQIKPKTNTTKGVEEQKDLSIKYTETTPDLMTETLAELYIAQGHTDKAIQALEILKLKNPEKSSYFARRIQELKKKK